MQSIQSRAKTDRLDSRGLGLYALAQTLPVYPLKSEFVAHLDQLLSARRGIAGAISSLEQQLQELPHAATPLRESIQALKAQRAELDRQITALTCTASPPGDSSGPPHSGDFQAQRPATQAVESVEISPLAQPELTPETLQRAMAGLQQIPGIGPVTAATLASCLHSRHFSHRDQFVAYCGLDVGVIRSGQRQGERGLTKQGDAELRRLLYLCAQASVRTKGSPFQAQYERELAKGLSKVAALCAVARKLARLCWSVVKHGSDYDPARVYQQSATKNSRPASRP